MFYHWDMGESPKDLVISESEIIKDLPVGLKYFQAVDAIVEGIKPLNETYYDILVYAAHENQPLVKILRVVSNYIGGNVGKQDEIELAKKSNRLQINAECGADGKYLKYPKEIGKEGLIYLNDVVEMFTKLSNRNKSRIRVNNTDRLIAKNGMWIDIEKQERSKKSPRLDKAKPKLPSE